RIVQGFENPEQLAPYLNQLGRDHRKFAVAPGHYAVVGESLIAALAKYAREDWTPELEDAWRHAYQIAARTMIDPPRRGAPDEPPWWNAQVVAHERRAADIAVLTVRLDNPMRYVPGQYVAMECPRRPRLWRPYSIANAPRPDGSLEFHVKAVPGGWVSRALGHHTLVGDFLRLRSPGGSMGSDPSPPPGRGGGARAPGLGPAQGVLLGHA